MSRHDAGRGTGSSVPQSLCSLWSPGYWWPPRVRRRSRRLPGNFAYTIPGLTAGASYCAEFWHENAINGLQYGFPYDDDAGQSSDIRSPTPIHGRRCRLVEPRSPVRKVGK